MHTQIPLHCIRLLSFIAILLVLTPRSGEAGSATWDLTPGSGDWNTAANWTPATVPNSSADTATFGLSATSGVSLSANTEVNGITFNAGASAYTITIGANNQLTISGTGITNNSGITQNFVTPVSSNADSTISFTNSATAGALTAFTNNGVTVNNRLGGTSFQNSSSAGSGTFTNNGATVSGANPGFTSFSDTSTAGSGTFINNGGTVSGASGGELDFNNSSTAANGTFTTNGGTVGGAFGGTTAFGDTSTAGNGNFTTNGATVSGASGGLTQFLSSATAANGTFTINAGTVSGANVGGLMLFVNTSTAGNGTFTLNGAAVSGAQAGTLGFESTATGGNGTFTTNGGTASGASGGVIKFNDSNFAPFAGTATAGNGTFTNNGGTVSGAIGGATEFFKTSTAGSGTFTNNGGTVSGASGGSTQFNDSSTAGSGTFTNNAGAVSPTWSGGFMTFNNTSTAGSGTFTNNGGTVSGALGGGMLFNNTSTAGSGTFTNNGGTASGAFGGSTEFFNTSTAGNGTFTNYGGTVSGAFGGFMTFNNASTAGSGTLTNNGGTVSGAGGGGTDFNNTSTAGSATLIANGGTGGGPGGGIFFYNDSMGGTARVIVGGNGNLDISGHNAPGVTVGSLEGNGNAFLGARNLTVGSNNLSTTFSGVISDAGGVTAGTGGSLTKIGAGTLILSGANTYTGDTNINAGVLQVDGSIASPDTFGNSGGTLRGTGTLGGNLTNSGLVGPGDSGPGTLTINGNYTQNANGTLQIQIGGTAAGQHDLLSIGGAASLNGTLQLVRLNNFTGAPGDKIIFLTVVGGVTGTFATVNTGTIANATVVYEPTDVALEFTQVAFASLTGLTRNQKSVAKELDEVSSDPRAAQLIAFLSSEPLANLPHDFDLIAPEELASIYEIGFSQAVVQNDNLQRRMDDIRAGSNGFCANGFTPQVSGKDYTKEADGKVSLPDKSTRDVYTPAPDNRWGVFVTGTGDFVNVGNDDSNAPGYDITTGDITVGADYRLCDHFAIGVDAGYSRSTADLVDDGRVDVDGGKVGAYATIFGKGLFGSKFYVDGVVGGGFNSYDTHRTGLQDEPVRGNTDGNEFNAMISYGSDWTFGCFNIGTWSSVQYTNVSIDQFTETGSLAPLIIEDQDENSFRSTTGVHASYDIKAGHFIFRPEVRAAYQHEYCDSAYQVDSQLASGAGGVFRVRGPDIGRDAALVGTGMNMQWNNRLATYVYYDGVLGRNNYDNNAVSGGFRIGF